MLQSSEKLRENTDAHEEAVVVQDEYRIRELFAMDRDIKYVVDLGANVGTASFKIQTFFPDAKIISCEPEAEMMKYCKLNTGNKLIYEQVAVIGDDRKEVTFIDCKWEGNGHVEGNFRWDLFTPMGSKAIGKTQVKACTLKNLMDKHKFPKIDLLKVDVEGMEGQILTKFKPHLKKVKHIRGEWHGDVDREIIRKALEDTHTVVFDQHFKTHGDLFAVRKGEEFAKIILNYPPIQRSRIIKRPGMPDKVQIIK